ncbi:Kiwa anti-phage protein KwaB-like domain-containing protein [Halorhabdus rudnickae]|uniref:Kiwa anti-phage protein KwaB-like domain-containing protein n=1 Tax=Halorhabdus rudnickae TaxID=1775544 RepID=UPI0010837E1B|nr:Kiwa anti-phage protein KwaB-like domain-containing protein [Halorhabdus rudnickae]
MTIDQFREAVNLLESNQELDRDYILGVEVPTTDSILAERNLTALEYHEISLDPEVRQKIQSIASSRAQSYLTDVDDGSRDYREYDITNTEQDTVPLQYADPNSIEHFERYEPLLNETNFNTESYDTFSDISFQCLRISNESDEQVLIFQKFSNRQISGNTEDLRISERDDQYQEFEDTVITIPKRVDCILYEGTIYVFASKKFEDIFDYLSQYERHANDVLRGIDSSELRIHNMDEFVDSILGDRRALRKMKSIEERGLYDSLDQSQVESIVSDYDLGIEIQADESGEWGIHIPDMRKKWDVIRLLDDDHLESSLTSTQYQVYGKDQRD